MYKGYLIDLDGTIYLGDTVIPSGKRFVERLQQQHIPFLFVTNNSSRLPSTVQQRLADLFDIHVEADHIYTSSLATAEYLDDLNKGKHIYIIGEEGLKSTLLERGYIWDEVHPDYVVVGLDKDITYDKLKIATLAIQKGAYFIGTNPDKNIPTSDGLWPSVGPNLAFLKEATGVMPDIVGKPNAVMMDHAVAHLGLKKAEVAMVGDNYETDILAGIHNDIPSILVLTGFTKKDEVAHLKEHPTHVVDTLDEWQI